MSTTIPTRDEIRAALEAFEAPDAGLRQAIVVGSMLARLEAAGPVILALSPAMLDVVHSLLDFHDDDELSEHTGHDVATIDGLRDRIGAAQRDNTRTTFDAPPVVGERVAWRTVAPWGTATGSGVYEGVTDTEHGAYHYFRDAEMNGTPQSRCGFPVDRVK